MHIGNLTICTVGLTFQDALKYGGGVVEAGPERALYAMKVARRKDLIKEGIVVSIHMHEYEFCIRAVFMNETVIDLCQFFTAMGVLDHFNFLKGRDPSSVDNH